MQDLEHDLEQVLNDEHYPTEETRQAQNIADFTTPRASTNRAELQSPQAFSVLQSPLMPSVMFTPMPATPPHSRPHFFAPGLPLFQQSQLVTLSSIT